MQKEDIWERKGMEWEREGEGKRGGSTGVANRKQLGVNRTYKHQHQMQQLKGLRS